MNPSYFRIKAAKQDAMERLGSWLERPELEPPKMVALSDAVTLACDANGNWRGPALYIYERDGWTVFEDFSGRLSSIPADSWLKFAGNDDFVLAGYNDAIGCGELIVIEKGAVVREFLYYADDAEENVDRGKLAQPGYEPLETWIEVASFVDDDELIFSERGLLWIHQ